MQAVEDGAISMRIFGGLIAIYITHLSTSNESSCMEFMSAGAATPYCLFEQEAKLLLEWPQHAAQSISSKASNIECKYPVDA